MLYIATINWEDYPDGGEETVAILADSYIDAIKKISKYYDEQYINSINNLEFVSDNTSLIIINPDIANKLKDLNSPW